MHINNTALEIFTSESLTMAAYVETYDDEEILNDHEYGLMPGNLIRREWVIRDTNNPFDTFDDHDFRIRYRFSKELVINIINMASFDHSTNRNSAISPEMQLITALRFYTTGSFHRGTGEPLGLREPTVCRIIHRVSEALANKTPELINIPGNANDAAVVKQKFQQVALAGFPGVTGAIDSTHVPISCPRGDDNHVTLLKIPFVDG